MLTLTSILAMVLGALKYAWVLLLLLIPQVLAVLQPIIAAVTKGVVNFLGKAWEGANKATWATWCLVFLMAGVAGAVGYYYGGVNAIDWAHEHFKFIPKKPINPWWKLW